MLKNCLSSGTQQVVLVCGSKSVGKSSFAKLVVNNLLNCVSRVGFLDTDLGQPEFTPPGTATSDQIPSTGGLRNCYSFLSCLEGPVLQCKMQARL